MTNTAFRKHDLVVLTDDPDTAYTVTHTESIPGVGRLVHTETRKGDVKVFDAAKLRLVARDNS